MKKRLLTLALAALLILCPACSTTQSQVNRYNAVLYVRGVLDETYTGVPDPSYLQLMDLTEEDAQATFEKNLEAEFSQRLAVRFDLDETFVSKTLKDDYLQLLRDVYAKAGYSVVQATPLDQGRYCVEVSVTPVTFFAAAYSDGYAALRAAFEKAHPLPDEEAQEKMTAAQLRKSTERFESLWAQEVYDYLYARLDAVTSGAAVTKLVLVTPDSQGYYSISPTDFQDIDDLVLQY